MMNKKIKENYNKLLKKDLESVKNDKDLQIKFRLRDSKDIILFEKFKEGLKLNKKPVSEAVRKIFIDHLEYNEQQAVWFSIRDDLYHAINRAVFVRIGAFMNKIQSDFYYQDLKIKAMNEKLNLILNILVSKPGTTINSDTINFPDKEFLTEPEYFSKAWIDLAEQDFIKYNQQKTSFFEQLKTMIEEDEEQHQVQNESELNEKV